MSKNERRPMWLAVGISVVVGIPPGLRLGGFSLERTGPRRLFQYRTAATRVDRNQSVLRSVTVLGQFIPGIILVPWSRCRRGQQNLVCAKEVADVDQFRGCLAGFLVTGAVEAGRQLRSHLAGTGMLASYQRTRRWPRPDRR